MKCMYCNSETKVTNKRDTGSLTRRRRECLKCKKRFTTHEKPELKDLIVIKKDGTREVFDLSKIKKGLMRACEKRPISIDKIEKVAQGIENKLREGNKKEIKVKTIGEKLMKALKKLDTVAYIRFASVYREFKDLGDFKKELKELGKK
jgi:transcriptional repressor NrdR